MKIASIRTTLPSLKAEARVWSRLDIVFSERSMAMTCGHTCTGVSRCYVYNGNDVACY